MNQKTIQTLSAQYYHELSNSVKYQKLANFFNLRGLTGISKFLCNQAKGEFDHAQKVIGHIMDMLIPLEPGVIDSDLIGDVMDINENGLLELSFRQILQIEQSTTEKLKSLNSQAIMSGDTLTSQWLYDPSGLLKEQIEEENVIKTIINRIESRMKNDDATGGIEYDIDVWIDQEYNK